MRGFDLSCDLHAAPARVWEAVQRPDTMKDIAGGIISFHPIDQARFPETWAEGTYRVGLRLFGIFPIGWQVIGIHLPPTDPPRRILHDRGHSPVLDMGSPDHCRAGSGRNILYRQGAG